MQKLLNLGCGHRYLTDWTNVDFVSHSEHVKAHNLLKGIPFVADTFDLVYHSHVLEHFSKLSGQAFMGECYRVLRKGGMIRLAVPDLEGIVREYLRNMENALLNEAAAQQKYEWSMLELYDQTVRNQSGGAIFSYWNSPLSAEQEAYVIQRSGAEYEQFKAQQGSKKEGNSLKNTLKKGYQSLKNTLLQFAPIRYWQIGKFRSSGEIHQWMYDRYSLAKLLQGIGFKDIKVCNAFESRFPNWEKHQWLDIENGVVRKPDSLFMEAVK
jgi:predicted SAM-dependent methyltransferase